MNNDNEFVLDFLSENENLYLKSSQGKCKDKFSGDGGKVDYLSLYRIDEITFEDKAPRKEALENVISSMNIEGVLFVYIILGNEKGVNFYYGAARDFSAPKKAEIEIQEIGEMILGPSLQGNFRGSKISELNPDERKQLLSKLDDMRRCQILEGVPGINKDDEDFQSADRIIDVMLGDEFALMVIARPMVSCEITEIQNNMYQLYNTINPISKTSVQESSGKSDGVSEGNTEGDSTTTGKSKSISEQKGQSTSKTITEGTSTGTNKGTTQGTTKDTGQQNKSQHSESGSEGSNSGKSQSDASGTSTSSSKSETQGDSSSNTKSKSLTTSTQSGNNIGSSTTIEIVNKKVQEWLKYLDDVIIPRLDYGCGKGLYVSAAFLMAKEKANLVKLGNTIKSIYGGESGNKVPFKSYDLSEIENSYVKKLQIPQLVFENKLKNNEILARTVLSQYLNKSNRCLMGNWMSSKELSLFAGLPQKEIAGLSLREEVEFGLNLRKNSRTPIVLGNLVQSGNVLDKISVEFDKSDFDKHVFVTGVTGSGKTTTCQKLLLESGNNFLVIEPAKTEYRILTKKYKDLLVFTLGKDTVSPFRLNPFEFFPNESITSRVDMIKASMEAAFDMEAAIPQILEAALYRCYENYGWNISTNKNKFYEDPFGDGIYAFPTLSDLVDVVEKIVVEQGFDDRLKNDYIGSIKARLQGLIIGSKGQMLNTPRSIDFVELLDYKVIMELEDIRSASEKSLVMAFILVNLSEAIKFKYSKTRKVINHITLIEEAHRLLSKYSPGDSMNKKQGVEMFADMLAEVRKYGESLIIADQIPNKLTPEVLKNTNTKIVHRIFAQDDKEAIGNTMALKDEQKEYLSYLESGRAIMMTPGWSKAIQVQITMTEDNNTERIPTTDEELRNRILGYYAKIHMRGVLTGLHKYEGNPSIEVVEAFFNNMRPDSEFVNLYKKAVHDFKVENELVLSIKNLINIIGVNTVAEFITITCYSKTLKTRIENLNSHVRDFLIELINEGINVDTKKYDGYLGNVN